MFVAVLLVEMLNFIWYENITISDVILHNDLKLHWFEKYSQNITYEYPGLDVNTHASLV